MRQAAEVQTRQVNLNHFLVKPGKKDTSIIDSAEKPTCSDPYCSNEAQLRFGRDEEGNLMPQDKWIPLCGLHFFEKVSKWINAQ